ncbi:MAG: hypothetical protein AVDCRST_MAG93-6948, partial [uncultured Chloroflexia bacterium]
ERAPTGHGVAQPAARSVGSRWADPARCV